MSECCSVGESRMQVPATMPCPVSGTRSKQVSLASIQALVRHLPLGMPSTQYYFCEEPECDVVYFPRTEEAPLFRRKDLSVPVWPKEQDNSTPICYCFGFTRKDIQSEMLNFMSPSIPERIKAEVQAGNCACEVKNPSGKCCLGSVVRIAKSLGTGYAENCVPPQIS
jgi:hypothetical protein